MKDAGVRELQGVRSRALRLAGLGRISKKDADNVCTKVDDLIEDIESMEESEG